MNAICRALELFCLFPAKILVRIASIFGMEINCNQSQQSTSSVYLFQNRSQYWTFPVEAVVLWVNRKPNKEFDLQMTGSQQVLFWYERTIISFQFFINLIRRKYFRIQASMNRGYGNECQRKQKKSIDKRAQQIGYERMKSLQSLAIKN